MEFINLSEVNGNIHAIIDVRYLECPLCEGTNIERQFEIDGDDVFIDNTCECGFCWVDVFDFHHSEVTFEKKDQMKLAKEKL
jgi:hypothetical protein